MKAKVKKALSSSSCTNPIRVSKTYITDGHAVFHKVFASDTALDLNVAKSIFKKRDVIEITDEELNESIKWKDKKDEKFHKSCIMLDRPDNIPTLGDQICVYISEKKDYALFDKRYIDAMGSPYTLEGYGALNPYKDLRKRNAIMMVRVEKDFWNNARRADDLYSLSAMVKEELES